MKFSKHKKSVFGILLALTMVVTTMLPMFAVFAEPPSSTGSITLEAPKDESGNYVDLGSMDVKAYQILDEEDVGMFTVNDNFTSFFATATEKFYEGTTYVDGDALKTGVNMYISYDSTQHHLTLANEKPVGESIEISTNDLKKMVGNRQNEKYFAAALVEAILSKGEKVGVDASTLTNTTGSKLFAEWLRKYINQIPVSPGATKGVTDGVDGADKIEFTGLNLGYWLLLSSNAPPNVANVEAVFRLAKDEQDGPTPSVDAQMKLETQKVDKQVQNSDGSYGDKTSAQVNDILSYKISAKIPDLTNYNGTYLDSPDLVEGYKFQFDDTLHNQWLVNSENEKVSDAALGADQFTKKVFTITIKLDEAEVILKDDSTADFTNLDDWTYSKSAELPLKEFLKGNSTYGAYTDENKQNFILEFDVEKLRKLEVKMVEEPNLKEAEITIEYKAQLTSDAVLQNGNDVSLEYSNDPHSTTSTKTPEDKTTVYSYGFDLTKAFEKEDGTTINPEDEGYDALAEKVVFNLYSATNPQSSDDWNEAPIEVVGSDGDYTVADEDDLEGKTADLKLSTTETKGHLKVYGLKEGYYKLKETGCPAGYAKISEIIIYIKADGTAEWKYANPGTTVKQGGLSIEWKSDNDALSEPLKEGDRNYLKFTVTNMKGMDLPDTGGIGFWVILIGGVLLITIAGVILFSRKKNGTK